MKVPFPDASFSIDAEGRLQKALVEGTGLGQLDKIVSWSAKVQQTDRPSPFRNVMGLAVTAKHDGNFAAGEDASHDHDPNQLLTQLAQQAKVPLEFVDAGQCVAAEHEPALEHDAYIDILERGRQAADRCIDSGADLLILGGMGPGTTTAAIAVTAHLTRTPFVDLSPRIYRPNGVIDDYIWMRRTAAIRDAMARAKGPKRNAAETMTHFGGPAITMAAAIIVAAGARRTPILIDGPVGHAAALTSRDFSLGAPKWCYAPDRIPHPVVKKAAGQAGMIEPIGPGLDIGEGCASMHSFPGLQSALRLVNELPYLPDEPETSADVAESDEPEAIEEPGQADEHGEGVSPDPQATTTDGSEDTPEAN